ncbi:MAG: lipopolysaccharide assembly protein LapA domain-containing protein [Bacillota bacterium]
MHMEGMGEFPVIVLAVAFVLVFLAIAAFALQNPELVSVSFLAWTWQLDVGRLVVIFAVAGATAASLLLGADDVRVRVRARQLSRQIHRLEARLAGVEAERDRLSSQLDGIAREGEAEAAPQGDTGRAPGAPAARSDPQDGGY